MMAAWGGGGGGGAVCFPGIEFQFCKMKKALETRSPTENICDTTELYTCQWLIWYILLCVFCHN